MIILGIDPGLQKTGWGILQSEGHALKFIACGLIKTNPADSLAQRLSSLHFSLCEIMEGGVGGSLTSGKAGIKPDAAAVEETFVNRNPASALKLGQARGVCLSVPALHGIPVAEYAANKIKKAIVGTGHADKNQMGVMVRTLLPGCGVIGADEADALAVAICHAHHGFARSHSREGGNPGNGEKYYG